MTASAQRPRAPMRATPQAQALCHGDAPLAWARYLTAPAPSLAPGLSEDEARRVQRHRDRLLAALECQDRAALEWAKQEVLEVTYLPPGSPALRRALRELSWRMAGLLLPRHRRH